MHRGIRLALLASTLLLLCAAPKAYADTSSTPTFNLTGSNSDHTTANWTATADLTWAFTLLSPSGGRRYDFDADSSVVTFTKGSGYIDAPCNFTVHIIRILVSDGSAQGTHWSYSEPNAVVIPYADTDVEYDQSPSSPATISSGLRLRYDLAITQGMTITTHYSDLF